MAGMAATAALGLHLLGTDSAGALGPMTAAVVVLGAGGSVSPSGSVEAFGLDDAEAHTALAVTPLGDGGGHVRRRARRARLGGSRRREDRWRGAGAGRGARGGRGRWSARWAR